MNAPLALGILLLASVVGGVALWPQPTAAAERSTPRPAAPAQAASPLRAGLEADVARTVLALLPENERARAVVAETIDARVMVTRQVPATVVAVGGGVPLADLAALPRELLARLLEHAAATLTGALAADEVARLPARLRHGVTFAFAGELRPGASFYVRLHGDGFVAEWVTGPDGSVHAAWRDFARDAARPWLGEQVFGTQGR